MNVTGEPGSAARLRVGTYAHAGGAGLYPLHHAAEQGWWLGEAFPAAQNASFGTYSARHGLLYLVDEQGGAIGAFRRHGGRWERQAHVPTGGAEPCYLALNGAQDLLAVANYGSGSLTVFRLDDETGAPRDPILRPNSGRGPVAGRQDGPHAHCACFSPDGDWLYHVDLGTDEIIGYPLDGGSLGEPRRVFAAPAGAGPRHLVFHPSLPLALLVSELASTLAVLELGPEGTLAARQTISTLPSGFAGESLGGHLSIDAGGRRVYVTNRGHDSVAVFGWDAAGTIELLQHVPSGGASPRAFVLIESEGRFVVANEEGQNVTFFRVGEDGTLTAEGPALTVPGAAFLFVEG